MTLISSPLCFVLVNGIPSKPYHPSRGIRQGDPLSPFLFIIMAEGLGCIIKHVVQSHDLRGLFAHGSPAISHQQFVDDNMLFGHPSVHEARAFKALLFSEASSTTINTSKSQIFFFHTPIPTQRIITRIIGFSQAKLPSQYLGAPLIDSALKHASWDQLIEKMKSRLMSWTYRTLNMASRLVLIKSVLQSTPLYLFSVLAAPKWVLKRIRNLQRNFLWGSTGQNRKWALVKWDKVCRSKRQGGLGLRDPQHSNTLMGARIWWQWVSCPQKLWAQLWTAKQWKPVRQIAQHETKAHNTELHKELTSRRIKVHTGSNVLRWGYTPKGTYTTKEAYQIMCQTQEPIDPAWHRIWTTGIWPKVFTFIWLRYHQIILTWDNLIKRGFHGPSYYPNCQSNEETIQHLMDSCHMANQLWEKLTFKCQRPCRLLGDIRSTIRNWTPEPYNNKILNKLWTILPGLLLWKIWKERNKQIFKNHKTTLEIIWTNLCHNIKENLALHQWTTEDFLTQPHELSIWANWNL
eukprot:PITA_30690